MSTPPGAHRHVLVDDVGYGHGTVIAFDDGHGTPHDQQVSVTISVHIPVSNAALLSSGAVPLQVTAWSLGAAPVTVTGQADQATVTITLHGP